MSNSRSVGKGASEEGEEGCVIALSFSEVSTTLFGSISMVAIIGI